MQVTFQETIALRSMCGGAGCAECRNALTYVLFMEGIPVIYYGTEQGFTDPHPFRPDPRAPLWTSQYQHEHPLWLFLKTAITYRKQAAIWDAGTAVQHYADAHYLVLSRGAFVIVLTNVGEDGPAAENATVHMVHDLPERFWGRSLQNIFNPEVTTDWCLIHHLNGLQYCKASSQKTELVHPQALDLDARGMKSRFWGNNLLFT